tara:strand:- start:934 stop:1134 length:201 start_codon:yes stop_codon:yes gene_type:complete
MENNISFSKSYNITKTKFNKQKKNSLEEILNEYSLKRNNFNPTSTSPNKFVTKLQLRMQLYYSVFK